MVIPPWITYDSLDKDGWPQGINEASRQWAIDLVRAALRERGDLGLTLLEARELIFESINETRPASFWMARMKLWDLAVSYHVLTMARTNCIWVLEELRPEYQDE